MEETILQFGTGNFLRGFADAFLDTLNRQGLYAGKAVIVSPTDSPAVARINRQQGRYHLLERGLEEGKPVRRLRTIESVTRAVNPYRDFDAFLSLAENPALRFVISNTTEAGIRCDIPCAFTDRPAAAFPAKVTQFLYHRYQKGLPGLVFFACELIDNNGDRLRECVLHYAGLWQLGEDFAAWVTAENRFCNTLVDRIVTGFPKEEAEALFAEIGEADALLDTAEPYHLWVIEGNYEQELPLQKAGLSVLWTADCAPYKKRKVRVLNGCHTALVFPSLLCGVASVGESLADPLLRRFLDTCLYGYILPALGDTEENRRFAADTLQRFANPYIRHLWQSIALNSVSKFAARVVPTIGDILDETGEPPRPLVFSLACLLYWYKHHPVQDDPAAAAFLREQPVDTILARADFWGRDLSVLTEPTVQCLTAIEQKGIREAILWILS